MSVHTVSNPFVPRASVIHFPNGVFEIRVHVQGVASDVQLVPHDNYILVTGRVVPRAHIDANGTTSKILWADYPCGFFGRDIQLKLSPNTSVVILERRQDRDDLVIRYTLRPNFAASYGVVYPQVDAYSAGGRPNAQINFHQPFAPYSYPPYSSNVNVVNQQRWTSYSEGVVNQPLYGNVNSGVPVAPIVTSGMGVPNVGVGVAAGAGGFVEGNAHLGGHVGLHAGPINVDVGGGVSGHVDGGLSLKEGVLVSV